MCACARIVWACHAEHMSTRNKLQPTLPVKFESTHPRSAKQRPNSNKATAVQNNHMRTSQRSSRLKRLSFHFSTCDTSGTSSDPHHEGASCMLFIFVSCVISNFVPWYRPKFLANISRSVVERAQKKNKLPVKQIPEEKETGS